MKSACFTDFDAFSDAVSDIDASMMLRNVTRHMWAIEKAETVHAHVQRGQLGSGNLVEGESWSDGYLIYLPLSGTCEYRANGATISDGSIMLLEPRCEFCLSTLNEHDWCTLFVQTSALPRHITSKTFERSDRSRCRIRGPDPALASAFQSVVREIMNTARYATPDEMSKLSQHIEDEMVRLMSAVVAPQATSDPPALGRPPIPRAEVYTTCRRVLTEYDDVLPTVAHLAAAAGVSERTLRRVFLEYTGMGPKCYMNRRRLHKIHQVLSASNPEAVMVTEVAFRFGVWELGRLSVRYRRLFGETPSETLHRRPRDVVFWSAPLDDAFV